MKCCFAFCEAFLFLNSNLTEVNKQMKIKFFVLSIFLMAMFAVNASAQTVDINKLPQYIVVAATNGGILSDVDIDIRIKKSKYADELKKLEKRLNNDDFVETYTDLLNEMDEIGYDFIDSFENKIKGNGLIGDAKVRNNLVFRKKGN